MKTGAKLFGDAPRQIKVRCKQCGKKFTWSKKELQNAGVGKDAAMPDLIHGLARLLDCRRQKLSVFERKSKPCGLQYVDMWED